MDLVIHQLTAKANEAAAARLCYSMVVPGILTPLKMKRYKYSKHGGSLIQLVPKVMQKTAAVISMSNRPWQLIQEKECKQSLIKSNVQGLDDFLKANSKLDKFVMANTYTGFWPPDNNKSPKSAASLKMSLAYWLPAFYKHLKTMTSCTVVPTWNELNTCLISISPKMCIHGGWGSKQHQHYESSSTRAGWCWNNMKVNQKLHYTRSIQGEVAARNDGVGSVRERIQSHIYLFH